jgi:HAE1 family hydrophobic/amphiphilic exporter-1
VNSPVCRTGTVFSFAPPAIPGAGTSGGFQFVIETAPKDVKFLADNVASFLTAARKRPEIAASAPRHRIPQQPVDVDRAKF